MPIHDNDEQFERYLKQFRPLAPEPLSTEKHVGRTRGALICAAWAAFAAAVLFAAWLTVLPRFKQVPSPDNAARLTGVEQLTSPQPLTVGSTSALLARAPSFKTAVDQVAFQPRAIELPIGTRSAFATLDKEDSKL